MVNNKESLTRQTDLNFLALVFLTNASSQVREVVRRYLQERFRNGDLTNAIVRKLAPAPKRQMGLVTSKPMIMDPELRLKLQQYAWPSAFERVQRVYGETLQAAFYNPKGRVSEG